ncbi:MAG TPA: ABC transporter permease [Vicinamibacterales bacterium]|nr:ABC transporter permease [Vicinamibacterales bacterium]
MPRALTHLADRTYRLLLAALPGDVRRDFGDDMVQLFRDHRRETVGRPWALAALWIAAAYDVFAEAVSSRSWRPAWSLQWRSAMRATGSDVRHGFRLIRRYPASAAIAILTLALGIGANAAIFSVVDSVLLRSLPYPEPDRLVMVWEKRIKEHVLNNPVSAADFLDWRTQNDVFENMAAETDTSISVTGDGDPVVVSAEVVSWAFFDVLGVRPQLGRTFQPDDEGRGPDRRRAVITDGFWRQRYGADPNVVGRKISLNGNPWTVIGVLPPSFHFVDAAQVFAPLVLDGPGITPSRVSHNFAVYARIKHGVTFAQASASMDQLGARLEQEHPKENANHGAYVSPLRDELVGPVRTSLVALFAAVGVVLLIACVNVASLLLARAASRQREMAVRAALGASRGRLVSQTLVESIVLSVAGAVTGIGVAELLIRALPVVLPSQLSVVGIDEIALNWRVLLFAAALAMLTGVAFGLLPALHASAPNVSTELAHGGRSAPGIRRRARLALVIGEVALAALALVGAGLVMRSFAATMAQPLGFDPAGRVVFTISMPAARYPTPETRIQALADIEDRLRTIPGASSVGAIDLLPLNGGDSRTGIAVEGREPKPDEPPSRMHPRLVTPGYFQTMGVRLVRGRAFTPADRAGSELVAVINEAAGRRFWGDTDPIGKRFRFGGDDPDRWRTIVGVTVDVRHWGLRRDVNPMVYLPQAQEGSQFLTFVVRSDGGSATIANAARATAAQFDPNLPLADVRTMDQVVATSVRSERAQTILMATFGITALALAMIGIYGVMGQLVTARQHEIGVRMALGARPTTILRQLLTESCWQAAIGLIIGLTAGAALMRLATALLFNVTPTDPLTLAFVGVILLGAALVACVIPGRRAMRTDPVEALKGS